MKSPREKFVLKGRVALLQRRGWDYLKYLHARQAMQLMKDCESFLFVGSGYGFAEVLLAAEYPDKTFIATDYKETTHDFERARQNVDRIALTNIDFTILDVRTRPRRVMADAVLAVDLLQYLDDAAAAARHLLKLGSRAAFCLAPFATAADRQNGAHRRRALAQGQKTVGFDRDSMRSLLGPTTQVRGAYWRDGGQLLRTRLAELSISEIAAQAPALYELAGKDIRQSIPANVKDAQAIKGLVRLA
jgi:SAM-dependent methyltransferase